MGRRERSRRSLKRSRGEREREERIYFTSRHLEGKFDTSSFLCYLEGLPDEEGRRGRDRQGQTERMKQVGRKGRRQSERIGQRQGIREREAETGRKGRERMRQRTKGERFWRERCDGEKTRERMRSGKREGKCRRKN